MCGSSSPIASTVRSNSAWSPSLGPSICCKRCFCISNAYCAARRSRRAFQANCPFAGLERGPILAVGRLFNELGRWAILDRRLSRPKQREAPHAVGLADRVFALAANRLIRPGSEHVLVWRLETDFVCDRQGRRFMPPWRQQPRARVDFRQRQRRYHTLQGAVEVERGFRSLRDVLGIRPIYQPYEQRVRGQIVVKALTLLLPGSARLRLRRCSGRIFVTALALLVRRMLARRFADAKCGLAAAEALLALETVRLVEFEVDGQKRRGVTTGSTQAR